MTNYLRLLFVFVLLLPKSYTSQSNDWENFLVLLEKENLKEKELKKSIIKIQNNLTEEERWDCFELMNDKFLYPKYKLIEYFFCRKIDSLGVGLYHIKFYTHRKKIIKLELTNPEFPDFNISFKKNKFNDLLKLHSNKMLIEPDTLHKYFIPKDRVIVSFGCYYGGEWFQEMKDIQQFVDENNKDEILKWCTSLSPEIRTHGAVGLIWLFEKGIELTDKEIKILQSIYNENSIITTCGGCTGYDYEKISDFLKYAVEDESTLKKLNLE